MHKLTFKFVFDIGNIVKPTTTLSYNIIDEFWNRIASNMDPTFSQAQENKLFVTQLH